MATKLCRDCRHSDYQHAVAFWGNGAVAMAEWITRREAGKALGEDMKCRHEASGVRSVVTGIQQAASCESMRYDYSKPCGPDATLWEAPDAQDS